MSEFRDCFENFKDRIHLNNAGIGPITIAAKKAVNLWSEKMALEGALFIDALIEELQVSTRALELFLGTNPGEAAFTPTCAASISQAAFGFDLRPADEIIQWDQEYPSNAYPWISTCKKSGARLVRIKSSPDYEIDSSLIIEKINSKTKMVVISMVQFQTGAQSNLKLISQACQEVGALLVVDAIQAIGVVPFEFKNSGVDILCGGSHKWVCAPLGLGFLAMKRKLIPQCAPLVHGAFTYATPDDPVRIDAMPKTDARRFEPGSPPALAIFGAVASFQEIQRVGIHSIWGTANALAHQLREGLKENGFETLDQGDDSGVEYQSPIVTFRAKNINRVQSALDEAKVSFALRAGGIRLSPHGFNTKPEIERVLAIAGKNEL